LASILIFTPLATAYVSLQPKKIYSGSTLPLFLLSETVFERPHLESSAISSGSLTLTVTSVSIALRSRRKPPKELFLDLANMSCRAMSTEALALVFLIRERQGCQGHARIDASALSLQALSFHLSRLDRSTVSPVTFPVGGAVPHPIFAIGSYPHIVGHFSYCPYSSFEGYFERGLRIRSLSGLSSNFSPPYCMDLS
jgi:hypothetical protein